MNFNELKELIQLIDQSNLSNFQYAKDGLKLKIEKNAVSVTCASGQSSVLNTVATQPEVISHQTQALTVKSEVEPAAVKTTDKIVHSPLVGVFYASPTPTSAPYVTVGQKVNKGDTLCIVEAMKVMNEITAECDGVVLEICPENESLVEYGQALVRIG